MKSTELYSCDVCGSLVFTSCNCSGTKTLMIVDPVVIYYSSEQRINKVDYFKNYTNNER